jgi:hypothetical protein
MCRTLINVALSSVFSLFVEMAIRHRSAAGAGRQFNNTGKENGLRA